MYAQSIGRYLSLDPTSLNGDMLFENPFVYALNNPVNRIEPAGKPREDKKKRPFPVPPDSGKVPSDIEDDRADECIFECIGSPKPPSIPPGKYCPGLWEDTLIDACNSIKKCGRITVGGHGVKDGVGATCRKDGSADHCFGCHAGELYSPRFKEIINCFKERLGPGGYIRICSCDSDPAPIVDKCLVDIAKLMNAKICSCYGDASSQAKPSKYCVCHGTWICRDP